MPKKCQNELSQEEWCNKPDFSSTRAFIDNKEKGRGLIQSYDIHKTPTPTEG